MRKPAVHPKLLTICPAYMRMNADYIFTLVKSDANEMVEEDEEEEEEEEAAAAHMDGATGEGMNERDGNEDMEIEQHVNGS